MTAAILELRGRTFSSLRKHRNYRLFFSGQVISVSGTWMQNIAMAWLILQLTHSPLAVGVLALCQFLPFTVFGLFAGSIVDRLDIRHTVIATQAASMVLASALAVLTLGGIVTPLQIYVLAALRGTVLVLDAPARQALTFQMVGRDELPNAVALNSSLFNAARVVGPAAGGAVVALAGAGFCFAFNAFSFLSVLTGLLLMRESELFPIARADRHTTMLRGAREGLSFVRRTPQLRLALTIVLVVSTFAFNFNVLLPVIASRTLHSGAGTFGIISACFGAGALTGALLAASRARASWRTLLVGTGGFGLAELVLAPETTVLGAGILLFATGVCFTLWTANSNSILQLNAPDHLRGRVVGLYYFAFNGTGPAAGLLAGWLASTGGTALALFVGGTAGVLMTAFATVSLSRRRLSELDAGAGTPSLRRPAPRRGPAQRRGSPRASAPSAPPARGR